MTSEKRTEKAGTGRFQILESQGDGQIDGQTSRNSPSGEDVRNCALAELRGRKRRSEFKKIKENPPRAAWLSRKPVTARQYGGTLTLWCAARGVVGSFLTW